MNKLKYTLMLEHDTMLYDVGIQVVAWSSSVHAAEGHHSILNARILIQQALWRS